MLTHLMDYIIIWDVSKLGRLKIQQHYPGKFADLCSSDVEDPFFLRHMQFKVKSH